MAALLGWTLELEEQGRGDPLKDDKAHLWRWDLSQSDLGSGLGSGGPGHLQGTKRLIIHALHPAATRTWVCCQALGRGGGLGRRGAGSSATGEGRGCRRGGGGKVGGLSPPPPAPEATFGFIIGSLSGSFLLI